MEYQKFGNTLIVRLDRGEEVVVAQDAPHHMKTAPQSPQLEADDALLPPGPRGGGLDEHPVLRHGEELVGFEI
mgnify:CR=1 FL=1